MKALKQLPHGPRFFNRQFLLVVGSFVIAGTIIFTVLASTKVSSNMPLGSTMFPCIGKNDGYRVAVFNKLAEAKTPWVRINYDWRGLETAHGTYSPSSLSELDRCVGLALDRGIKVDLNLFETPQWASTGSNANDPPTDNNYYGEALTYLINRYKNTSLRIDAWEIWNEENGTDSWNGSVDQYVALLKVSYAAVKAADPSALVVFGGVSPSGLYHTPSFISQAYAANAQGHFDVMATHPYPWQPGGNDPPDATGGLIANTTKVRDIMNSYGDTSKPIWFTEVSWQAPKKVNYEQQANYLTKMFQYVQTKLDAQAKPPVYVTNIFWFVISYTPCTPEGSVAEGYCMDALLNSDLSSRPSYSALKAWNQPASSGGTSSSPSTSNTTTSPTAGNAAGTTTSGSNQTTGTEPSTKGVNLLVTVVNQKNKPVVGANVTFNGQDVATDKKGQTTLHNLPPGKLLVSIDYRKHATIASVIITPGSIMGNAKPVTLKIQTTSSKYILIILPCVIFLATLVIGVLRLPELERLRHFAKNHLGFISFKRAPSKEPGRPTTPLVTMAKPKIIPPQPPRDDDIDRL